MIDFEITKVGGMASSNSQPVLERKVSHSPSPLRNQVPATQRGYVDRLKAHSSEGSTRNNNCVAFDVKKPSHQTFVNSKSQESNDSATMEPKLLKEKNGIINSLIKTNKETLSESPIKLGEVKLENDDLKTKTENKNFVNSETKELEKVMENVNKDLSITKDWKLKNSKQRTCNDPLAEDNIKTVLNKEEKNEESSECSVVKDVNTSSDNSSNSTMHLNNSSSCKNSLLNERTVKSQKTSPLPHSSDELNELDDMSIDLTEEEEEALLGKNEPTDMDTDLDLQVDVGSANLADENDTKEIDISQQEWQIVDEVDASSPEDASEKNPSADISSSSRIDDQLSPNKTTNDKTETKEGHDEDIEFSSSQDTQLAPEDSPESKFSSPSLSQGSQNDEKTLTEDCDKISSNGIENKTLNHDQGALNTMEDVDLPPVPDNAPKGENLLWNFKKVSANPTSEILKDLQFFDNTAKEEGLQKEVDRVVQKILTDIPPDGDSDDTVTIVDDKNVSSPVVLKSLNDKQIFNTEMISDKWASSIQNSPVKHPVATDSQLYNNDSNKTPKREMLLNQDENIKPDPSSPNYPGTSPVKTLPSVDDDKQDTDMKRKWKNTSEDGKPSELSGLTVKKVKLDTDTVREEMVALKSKLTTRTEPLKVKSETVARKLTQSELEDIIARRMSLYLTENERNEIGSLKSKCEHLEKSLEIWKRRANLAQKQTVELQIALQRIAHQNVRKTGTAPIVKLSTRSVGLQVQMHSFLVPEGKIAPRGGPITSGNSTIKMIPASNSAVQPVLPPKMPISSTMTSLHLSQSGRPILPNTTTATSIHTVNTMTTKAANNMPVTKTLGTHAGVSILQPRITNSQPTTNSLVMNTVSSASPSGSIPKVANVVTPAPPTVRNLLDSRRIQATMSPTGPPVPMRLVPNQAAKQAGTNIRSTVPSQAPPSQSTSTSLSSCATSATVKIIDLTADEDENNTSATQLQTSGVPSSNTGQSPITTQVIPVSTQKQVAILATPITQTSTVSNGQIIINPSPAKNSNAITVTAASARAPLAPALPQTSARLTYLVPSTMVRAPLYVANQPRQIQAVPPQNVLRPPIGTILLQKGTTLVPVPTQAPLANIPATAPQPPQVRMGSSTIGLRGVTTATTTFTSPSISSVTRPPPPLQAMPRAALPPPPPSGPSARLPVVAQPSSGTEGAGQTIVVSRIPHKVMHPAPLPSSPNVENSTNMKALPPKPALKISKVNNGIVLSWNMSLNANHSEIASYQLYAYQESNAAPSTTLWKKVGDVKALPLPMACTLTQFMEGHKYHFAVRAVDLHNRIGPFSDPGSIVLNNSTPTGIRV